MIGVRAGVMLPSGTLWTVDADRGTAQSTVTGHLPTAFKSLPDGA